MANPIDIIVTKEAIAGLTALETKLKSSVEQIINLSNEARKSGASLAQINSPAGLTNNTNANAQLLAQIKAQSAAIEELNKKMLLLQNTKKQSNTQTAEESVNQKILNQNANRQATATSTLAGAYRNLSAQQAIASQRYQDLIARGRTAEQTQRQYNRELAKAKTEFQSLNNRVLQADQAVGRFNRNVGNYPKQAILGIKDLLGAFGIVGGVGLIASVAKDIFNQTRELQSLDLALKQVIGTQEDFERSQGFLLRVSEQYGVGINALTKSYTQFYVSAKDKLAGSEIEGIFESISKAAGAMGLSVDQQQGAFLALTQMLSKGTIQAEELRGQLSERLPGAFGILAKSMGVTEQVLNKMLQDGKVMAAEVLPAFAKELEKAYGIENLNRVESLNASTTRLSNSWTGLIKSFNEGDGIFSKFLQTGINNLTIFLNLTKSLFTSSEKSRKSYLESQKELGRTSAINVVNQLKDADEKREYAEQALINTRKEIAKNKAEFDRLQADNKEIKESGTLDKIETRRAVANEKRIKELNNLLYKQVGYVNGLKETLKVEKKAVVTKTETAKATKKTVEEKEKELKFIRGSIGWFQELIKINEQELEQIKKNSTVLLKNNEAYNEKIKLIEDYKKGLQALLGVEEELQGVTLDLGGSEFITDEDSDKIRQAGDALRQLLNDYKKGFIDDFASQSGFSKTLEIFQGGLDKFEGDSKATALAISEAFQEAFNTIANASQQNFDAEYLRLERQKDVAMQFAGESTTAQLAIQEQYDERKRAIARREAESQKKLAIFNILVNTAQAVVAALPNIPLSVAIGIIGAIQAGVVSSQQIPQFFEGGVHDGGLMLVNDGKGSKYKETIVTPDGKIIKPQARNVLMDAPKGTQIFTHDQWQEQMMRGLLSQGISPASQPNTLTANDFNNGISKLANVFGKNNGGSLSIDERGIIKYKISEGKRTRIINNRLEIKSN